MSEPLTFPDLFTDSLSRTGRLIVPSLPFAAIFVVAAAGLVLAAGSLPQGGVGFVAFAAVTFLALFAHSLFSAAMYRAVSAHEGGMLESAWKLTMAWLLVVVVAAIGGSIIVLFFSLIGSSLGVVSGEPGQEITDMAAQMRDGGTFWPLFALFVATLIGVFWFAVRLMLFAGASVTRNRVHVFRTWSWTKGYFPVLALLMLILIIVPVAILSIIAAQASTALIGATDTPSKAALATGVTALIHLPGAWLGHGFAASVLARLAPPNSA